MMLSNIKLFLKRCLSRISRRVLGVHVQALLIDSGKYKFLVDVDDLGVGRHLRERGQYGISEVERIRSLIHPDSRVLIVGTHVGTLAIPVAETCAEVFAIEANPRTFELLSQNVAINGIENMHLFNLAASDECKPLRFLKSRVNSGGSKIVPRVNAYKYYYDQPEEVAVPGRRLDEVLKGIRFDLIVMDIEGSEYFALKGMQEILARTEHLIIEFVPHHLRDVSGVSVEDFLSVVGDFSQLTVPTLNRTVSPDQFRDVLIQLYRSELSDDGILFSRSAP